jgi:hypothetical protein
MDRYDRLLSVRKDGELLGIDHEITDMERVSHSERCCIELERIYDICWETLHIESLHRLMHLTTFEEGWRCTCELDSDLDVYWSLHIYDEEVEMTECTSHRMTLSLLYEDTMFVFTYIESDDMVLAGFTVDLDEF